MKKILLALSAIFTTVCETPKLVILRGIACSGKSSICRELIRQDDSWCVVSADDEVTQMLESTCREHCPTQMAVLDQAIHHSPFFTNDHFFHALLYRNIVYKKNISATMQSNALQAIDDIRHYCDSHDISLCREELGKRIFDKVCSLLRQGKKVILESWLYSDEVASLKNDFATRIVLAYCPLQTNIDRLIQRSCIEQEAPAPRYFITLWKNGFFERFQIAQTDEETLDFLDSDEINSIFELVQTKTTDQPVIEDGSFSKNEFNKESLEEFYSEFTNKFDLATNKKAPITNVGECDLILRTDHLSSKQCVDLILDSFEQD